MKTLILICLVLTLSGCFTMRIHNIPRKEAPKSSDGMEGTMDDEWHHDIIFGLVEITKPVNMKNRCRDGWDHIKIERTFLQGLINFVDYEMYSPWTVTFKCNREIVKPTTGLIEIPREYGPLKIKI